jgi:hypothetical protein
MYDAETRLLPAPSDGGPQPVRAADLPADEGLPGRFRRNSNGRRQVPPPVPEPAANVTLKIDVNLYISDIFERQTSFYLRSHERQ